MGFLSDFYSRSVKSPLVRQSALGMLFNALGVLFSIVTISFLLQYLGKDDYGIWLTIFSICSWINFLDGGLGNGLRNELTKKLVGEEHHQARAIISTGYITIFLFLLALYGILLLVHQFFDWNTILSSHKLNYNILALFVFGFFLIQMVLKLISKIYYSFKMASMSFLMPMVINFFIMVGVICFKVFNLPVNLWYVGMLYSFIPFLILIGFSIHFFGFIRPDYLPNIRLFDKKYVKVILKNGTFFFLIQMSSGILQATTPFFIALWFTASLNADYQISVRYYSFILLALNIFLQTIWTPLTTSYLKKNVSQLKKMLKQKVMFGMLLIVGLVFLYFISDFAYRIWLGKEFSISNTINLASLLFVISVVVSKVFVNFLNATDNIKLQSIISACIVVLYVPVAYLLVKIFNLGIISLILAPAIFYIGQMIFALFEIRKIFVKFSR
ncbi:lipopolysaccharide biosynthesis protein [Luteirhabdus pelagi]|uniref:lipopolysaccharide biosynthesis protein n=1 Tax=Luteirhabdus pelagi TaxID=2792783 RepID=UPI001939AD19|nr:hypothetical protein [Luteirhabdus pelagi]